MQFVVLLLSSVGAALALKVEQYGLLCAVVGISLTLLLILGFRYQRESSALKRLAKKFSEDSRSSVQAAEQIEGYVRRLRWQLDSLQSPFDEVHREILRDELDREVFGEQDDIGETHERLIAFLLRRFHGGLAAVAVGRPNESDIEVFVGPESSSRLETVIRQHFPVAVQRQLQEFSEPAFSPFGVGRVIYDTFTLGEGVKTQQFVILIGFRSGSEPSPSIQVAFQELVRLAQERLRAALQFSDLTKQVKEAESQVDQRSEFLAHVSHDIRSPLNNVKSVLHLLQLESENSEHQELIETALTNCRSLGEIVESILDYTKHRAGKLTVNKEIFSLRELVSSVVEEFRVTLRLKGLDATIISQVEGFVLADQRHLRRILTNLLSNAVKYTERGSITVELAKDEQGLVVLSVKDTGIGMSKEQVDQLFIPFSRFAGAAQYEGVGIGLALSKILSELNGAVLSARSIIGKGTTFQLALPAVQESEEKTERTTARFEHREGSIAPQVRTQAPTAKILLVDDNADILETGKRALSVYGFEVLTAIRESDAVGICNFELPDLVISDASMPQGGALRVLEALRERGLSIPMIVLTGSADVQTRDELFGNGAWLVLSKPIEPELLVEHIREVLSREQPVASPSQLARSFS